MHTDFRDAGRFECSHALLNRLQEATLWAYRGNFTDGYPTDCPHREKNGWTGDASLASELAMYNFQNTAAYAKWIGDMIDEQRPDGNVAAIVPTSGWGYTWGNGPAWDSALVIIPWMLYVYQGDARLLETAYEPMRRYVDYMTSRAKDGIVSHGLGDWIPVKAKTPVEVTSTGYYFLDAQIVARAGGGARERGRAAKYSALAAAIREAFTKQLYKGGGVWSIGSQTAQSCALHQGLVPAAERAATEAKLVEAVQAAGGFPDFGILGSKYVFRRSATRAAATWRSRCWRRTTPPSFGAGSARGDDAVGGLGRGRVAQPHHVRRFLGVDVPDARRHPAGVVGLADRGARRPRGGRVQGVRHPPRSRRGPRLGAGRARFALRDDPQPVAEDRRGPHIRGRGAGQHLRHRPASREAGRDQRRGARLRGALASDRIAFKVGSGRYTFTVRP